MRSPSSSPESISLAERGIFQPRLAALLLAGGLAACATPPPPAPEPPPPQVDIDGRYRGTARLVRAGGPGCPRSGARVLQIVDNTITLSYRLSARRLVKLTATATPDGTLRADDGTGQLDGSVRDGRLEVTVTSPLCENRWILTKVE